MGRPKLRDLDQPEELDERVIDINRVAKVVKGGRKFHFRVTVVVGDNKGKVGVGIGKARGVPDAIRKAMERGRKNMRLVPIIGTTIPHQITVKHGGAVVMLKPATPGTGVIAGGGVRAVLQAAGIRDILTKSLGSSNALNVVLATEKALNELKWVEAEAAARGKPTREMMPFWSKRDER
ncbi:MAG: 30S ribosomal protein S5 [Anaerolineales bacterium]|jgi:small subunit ribosomal protein S5|nr:30S ribosomal protein S5 [Anaerolineales bacterium]NOR82772.1 30S ribosomal protein S5 [Ardenticatenales bacterium]